MSITNLNEARPEATARLTYRHTSRLWRTIRGGVECVGWIVVLAVVINLGG